MIVKPFSLDKSKVKRIFTYGCSYTSYFWPTWANIISKEFPEAEFHNFGKVGLGNLAISCRIAETNARIKFNENDLVMVMWSTYTRNDHWITPVGWFGAGNVYGSDFYTDEYRKNYANSVSGFLIRDFPIISMASNTLDSLPCQAIIMSSVPSNFYDQSLLYDGEKVIINELIRLYKDDFDKQPISLLAHLNRQVDNPKKWRFYVSHRYEYENMPKHDSSKLYEDCHPSPKMYAEYLNNNILELSSESFDYALKSNNELLGLTNMTEIEDYFKTNNVRDSVLF